MEGEKQILWAEVIFGGRHKRALKAGMLLPVAAVGTRRWQREEHVKSFGSNEAVRPLTIYLAKSH